MKLLLVAPTEQEIIEVWRQRSTVPILQHATLLITGVGAVATACHLMRALRSPVDLVIHAGICGSFSKSLQLGEVVQVVAERFGDLGAQHGRAFLDVFDLQLCQANHFPFKRGWLKNPFTPDALLRRLPQVKGLTVNLVTGTEATRKLRHEKYQADVESMEGAALFYCCLIEKMPFVSIRSVSNVVERRRRNGWQVELAIKNLNDWLLSWLTRLSSSPSVQLRSVTR